MCKPIVKYIHSLTTNKSPTVGGAILAKEKNLNTGNSNSDLQLITAVCSHMAHHDTYHSNYINCFRLCIRAQLYPHKNALYGVGIKAHKQRPIYFTHWNP